MIIDLKGISKDLWWSSTGSGSTIKAVYKYRRQCPGNVCENILAGIPRNMIWNMHGIGFKEPKKTGKKVIGIRVK